MKPRVCSRGQPSNIVDTLHLFSERHPQHPNLWSSIENMLDMNSKWYHWHVCVCTQNFYCSKQRLTSTWHEGRIDEEEVWVKIGGDKGGGSFKMNFQLCTLTITLEVRGSKCTSKQSLEVRDTTLKIT